MNILFLTLQYDSKKEKEYLGKSKMGLQGAANTFQNNLLAGFKNLNDNVYVMNTLPVATFPRYNQILMKTQKGNILDFPTTEIGYINLPVLKQATRYLAYKKQVKKWIKNTKGEKCIIAYSLYLPFEKLFKYIKKKYPSVKTSLICPDLPCEFGILPKNKIRAKLQTMVGRKALKYAKYVDTFTLLTEEMKHPLNVGDRPYTVVEGVCNTEAIKEVLPPKTKAILYTGTINKKFGILTLLKAFSLLEDPSAELWICGGGDSAPQIKEAALKDSRIKFFGYVTKDEVLKLQSEAFMLINPRPNDGEYTKYSFPSKTMEYMLSGKPVLMYKLYGIPSEYDKFLYYISGNTPEDMKNAICEVFTQDINDLISRSNAAANFVAKNKNSAVSAKKIQSIITE